MSKYLGKLLLESGAISVAEVEGASVRYVQGSDAFCFRVGGVGGSAGSGAGSGYTFCAGAELVFGMCQFRGYLECQYQWSVGYAVREKKDASEFRSMRISELAMLGGRRELIISGALGNDYDFDVLCCLQYLYKFSDTFFKRVKGHWKRDKGFVPMKSKILGKSGRKKGSKNVNKDEDDEKESLSETLLRVQHNKQVAVSKGILQWYLEACHEECKVLGQKYDKEQCISEWDKLRQNEW